MSRQRPNVRHLDQSVIRDQYHPDIRSTVENVKCTIFLIYSVLLGKNENSARQSVINDLLFRKNLYCSDSVVLQSSSRHMRLTLIAVGNLYNVLLPKTVKQLGQRTDLELICHVCGLVICVISFLCFLCFYFLYSCIFYS